MLEQMRERPGTLSSHNELLLLWSSFAIPKIVYVFCTAPCFLSPELPGFDALLHPLLCTILNVLLVDESTWFQAALPVNCGVIGIRRSVQ